MGKFIEGQALATAIQEICSGQQVKCAVAFWGQGIPSMLFGESIAKARIICDLEVGGTNPLALKELKAPKNRRLRHHPGLHAKVYISDRGVVTASANASSHGLGGADQPPKLTEAGIQSTSDSDHWREADRWFKELWATSSDVDSDTLARAEESWERAANARALLARLNDDGPRPLLDLLKHNPDVFGEIRLFFTWGQADEEAVAAAIQNAEKIYDIAFARTLPGMEAYSNWGGVCDVPPKFINVHRGPRGANSATLLVSPGHYDEDHDVYFAHKRRLHDQPFSELQKHLNLGSVQSWGGYRLGMNHFSAEQFDNLSGAFHTAQEVSQILLGK